MEENRNPRNMITLMGNSTTGAKLALLAQITERSKSAWVRWVVDREFDKLPEELKATINSVKPVQSAQ